MIRRAWQIPLLMAFGMMGSLCAEDGPASTRPEMKRRLQALKERTPRLPLPPPTQQEIESGRSLVNNGRMRSLYLPPSWQSFLVPGWGRGAATRPRTGTSNLLKTLEADPNYGFKTRLFWVVSRTNDCQYCLGHQELKLKRIGMTDDQLAALDCRWELFPESEQAALRVTRKLTLTPHRFEDADVSELQRHYSDAEIIDIIYTVSRYNAVNRWTTATGIPQDRAFGGEEASELDTPTSAEYASVTSKVIPVDNEPRPAWESRDAVQEMLQAARRRTARVQLPDLDAARQALAKELPGVTPPAWFQAIAKLPIAADTWAQRQGLARDGKTAPELRVLIAWITARENRAWYALAHARTRYLAGGGDESALYDFAELERVAGSGPAEALRFARKLTVTPHQIVDGDLARLRENFSDHEVAEIIQLTCDANAFDRFTEALRLPLEF